jgi:O-antigen ligase
VIDRQPLTLLSLAAFLAVGAACAYACYRRPSWGIALLVAADPFLFSHTLSRTTITLPKVVLAGFFAGLLFRRVDWRPLWSPQLRPLSAGALAILAAVALSAIPAEYIDAVARETLKYAEFALVYACCAVAWIAEPDERPLRVSLIATTSVVVLAALTQEWTGAPSAVTISGRDIPRIAGPLEGPNQLAGYLVLCAPVLLARAFFARDRLALAAGALAGLGLILTLSRGGIAAALVALVVLALLATGVSAKRAIAGVAAFVVLAIVALGAIGGLGRLTQLGEFNAPNGLATRALLWPAAIELWKTSPWLGIGAGNYELHLSRVGLEGVRTHANSAYLQALSEGGLPLLTAVLWTAFAAVWVLAKSKIRTPLIAGAIAASAGFALHQTFDCMTFFVKVGEMWWILLGAAAGSLIAEQSAGAKLRGAARHIPKTA